MLDPTVSAAATAALEAVINKALQYDPATRRRLQALAGKSLAIEASEPRLVLCVHFDSERVRIGSHIDNPTTCLRGSLSGLLQLATSERVNLADSQVEAWGNTALLADIKAIASDLELDWEEAINDWLGDLLGHQLAEQLRYRLAWLKDRGQSGRRLLGEFLTEELRAVPAAAELRAFSDQVDQLRLAADRLEARLQRWRRQESPAATDPHSSDTNPPV